MNRFNRSSNLENAKQHILGFLARGPNITMKISNHLGTDSLISSAFLSELLDNKEIKMSHMKVGNSPIYYIPGHELQLDKFSQYLGGKEREAFHMLKEKRVLKDVNQLPAIRVALRSIKDFAFPVEIHGNLYWRFFDMTDEQAFDLVNNGRVNLISANASIAYSQPQIPKIEEAKPVVNPEIIQQPITPVIQEVKSVVLETPILVPIEKEIEPTTILEQSPTVEIPKEVQVKAKVRKKPKNEFADKIESFLQNNNISLVNTIKNGKKEYHALVSVAKNETEKQEYLCIAKEKKSISDKELMKNLQVGQKKNLPVLFISSGEMSKKAIEWADYLGNLIIYKRLE